MSWLTSVLKTVGVKTDSLTLQGLATGAAAFALSKIAPHIDVQSVGDIIDVASTALAIAGAAMTSIGYQRRKAMPAELPSAPGA